MQGDSKSQVINLIKIVILFQLGIVGATIIGCFLPGAKPCDADVKQHIANMMTVITTSTFALYAAEKMKDFKMPVAIITFLAAQAGGMVWFLSGLQSRVKALESFDSGIEVTASENRRYIREVIMPSYAISDNWFNPHYQMWLDQGGWADIRECKHD